MSYQCRKCLAIGDGRSFSDPDSGVCDSCQPDAEARIRELVSPYLTRWGNSDVGDLARAIRDVLDGDAR